MKARDWRTAKPKHSSWSKNVILNLDPDPNLDQTARALLAKRIIAGDLAQTKDNVKLILFGAPIEIPDKCTGEDARLIVLGHGVRDSKYIGPFLTPEGLVKKLEGALGNRRFGRIALKNCWGAGNRKPQGSKVPVKETFAWKFASYCGFATTVTAYTAKVSIEFISDEKVNPETGRDKPTGYVHTLVKDEGSETAREKEKFDKVIYYPQPGASVKTPKDPKIVVPDFKTLTQSLDNDL